MAIVTAKVDGTILYNETKEQVELNKRRAQFEINRKKVKCTIISKCLEPQLMMFSHGVAQAIIDFKRSKK